ncbi:hypothetical protein [Flavobacterium orientale]|uniref:Type II CBASS E2 protein domain-containing protein n=1 Tax=Flavobacterium orientale TaxID=1756020 RepID=A0A916Y420_9FLAO|nr:hypothetical protein [Flavobacterium orientale]GGD30459.1 hypothetical protein GCM10011343_20800 [Flavobacterium orientale]
MNLIAILAENIKSNQKNQWYSFLQNEKFLVEKHFDWLSLNINIESKSIIGKGTLNMAGKSYIILLSYSPYHSYRYDRIYIQDSSIEYNNDIHLYWDKSLCLYHPKFDKPLLNTIPLYKMIPWISEWIVFYEQWKKYGVWLGDEIKHSL